MGLFSSSTKTVVGTTVTRVIKDDVLPNSVTTGTIKSIFQAGDIPEFIMEEMVGSIGVRAERMYEYGRTKYTHGLPSGQIKTAVQGRAEVIALLSSLEGASALLLYCHYCPPNMLHIGWSELMSVHGYDPATNQLAGLTALKGKTVYLDDMIVVIPTASASDYLDGALDQWGTAATAGYTPERLHPDYTGSLRIPTPVRLDPAAIAAHVQVNYIWVDSPLMPGDPEVIKKGSFDIAVTGYDNAADYYHVKYSVGTLIKYQMYKAGSGTYPTLDAIFETAPAVNGTFFPFAYFRYNKASEIADKSTPAYKTSKKLVSYVGMDYDKVSGAIDDNPDIANVEQAMLVMAVPANTTNELEQRYLFAFFDNLFYADVNQFQYTGQRDIAINQLLDADISKSSLIIQDTRFKMALSNSGILKKRVAGNIGKIGSHASLVTEVMVPQKFNGTGEFAETVYTIDIPIKVHVYRQQISNSWYDEISVINLKMLYYVFENFTTCGDDLDDILLVPLDHSITEHFSIPDRETLYARSLQFVFNSRQVIDVKWYQQDWFQIVMMVVSVVIIVVSLGSATGPMAGIMGALATGSSAALTAAVWALVLSILEGLIIGIVLKLFVKAVGLEAAFLVAIVLALAGYGYQMVQGGSNIVGAPWAQELLQLSSGLVKAVAAQTGDMMKDLLAEFQSFNLFKDEAAKALEAANKLLEHNNYLNPFVIFGESPNDFYNRTVHSGNIGISGISAISSYVDIALTLPKLNETIEG